MRRFVALCLAFAFLFSVHRDAFAQTPDGTLYFNDAADSIQIEGQTVLGTAATYEAWVQFPAEAAVGSVFNEWTGFQEDKAFGVGTTGGYAYNHFSVTFLTATAASSLDEWHHFAFVHDGSQAQQRFYIDGELVASQNGAGDIGDGDGPGFVGAIPRDGTVSTSFRGFIDSMRISNVARYAGETVTPPRDLPSDEATLILYQFDNDDYTVVDGKARITDQSGNGKHGTLAPSSFASTSPAPPATQGDVDCSGTISTADALKTLRKSVSLASLQNEPCPDLGEVLTTGAFGDVDCSGSLSTGDALRILRFAVGLPATPIEGCTVFGGAV